MLYKILLTACWLSKNVRGTIRALPAKPGPTYIHSLVRGSRLIKSRSYAIEPVKDDDSSTMTMRASTPCYIEAFLLCVVNETWTPPFSTRSQTNPYIHPTMLSECRSDEPDGVYL